MELDDFNYALDRVIGGLEKKNKLISPDEKKIIAYHESGHALVAKLIPGCDPVHKVSIVSRGPALGYTLQLPTEDRHLTTRTEILNKLAVLLGGRSAEEIVFQELTTGAHDDLSKVTSYAQKMVMEFGMSEKIGPISLKKEDSEVFLGRDIARQSSYSEETARNIDSEIRRIINASCTRARELLSANRAVLDALAAKLIEREVLESADIDAVLKTGESPA